MICAHPNNMGIEIRKMFILLFFFGSNHYNVRDETHSYIRKGRICMHRPGSTKMLICSEPLESKIKMSMQIFLTTQQQPS